MRRPDGHWGRGFYQPKWISTHYTLLDLKHLGIAPDHPQIRESIGQILAHHKEADGGVNPAKTVENSDVCVNGMVLNYAAYFGTPTAPLQSVVDFLIGVPLPDGGFNCESNQHGAVHSSLHSTISVLEGIGEYLANGYTYRAAELDAIARQAQEFVLQHRLFRSDRTGEIINPRFLAAVLSLALVLRHPARAGLLQERWRERTIPACRTRWMSCCKNAARMAPGRCRPNTPARCISTWRRQASPAAGIRCGRCGCLKHLGTEQQRRSDSEVTEILLD